MVRSQMKWLNYLRTSQASEVMFIVAYVHVCVSVSVSVCPCKEIDVTYYD